MSEAELLARADRYLRSAKLLLDDGDLASSISRSYYAMFYAPRAALETEGIDADSHRGVISTFGERFVKSGPLDRGYGRDLSEAFRQRNLSEYEPTRVVPEDTARSILDASSEFVDRIRAMIG